MSAQDFEQYLRQSEPSRNEKANAWQAAVGLQAVDGGQVQNLVFL